MSPLLMSVIVFACVFGGAVIGIFLRNRLPEHHLSGDTCRQAGNRSDWDHRSSCTGLADRLGKQHF